MRKNASALKRSRQNLKRKIRNVSVKSELKTIEKRCINMIKAGKKDEAIEFFKFVAKKLDTASRKRIIHKNKAARKKSRLNILLLKQGN
ncbi:30S ribosomal protein S20 [Borreliella mayonii]|uniref:Small ribosomal subunit protein bS20 n=1 Tax=Borreliella mayonii TaxID=1674146 RepID=A0AAC9KY51_9SPIR|nr:30S ribosomal protein S20 [Borreliella mayonii]APS98450.1 30S ribosomal protein S20 [Borreliella mayonii]APS99575.1 30S ribosomal protein S20 [Borreliella mayonii]